jgi:hypothetical protein
VVHEVQRLPVKPIVVADAAPNHGVTSIFSLSRKPGACAIISPAAWSLPKIIAGGYAVTSRITLDRYVYEDIYPAFKATTDEKEITARINRSFLNHLAALDLVIEGHRPTTVADIGCGPCDTLVRYLNGVTCPQGFIVRATDFLPAYADAHDGEALRILAAAQSENTLKIIDFSTQAGDAFGGRLLDLLSAPRDGTSMRHAFYIVFASHMMYHAESTSQVDRFLTDVAGNLLATGGVCVMYHVAITQRTFQEFRARFGSQAGASAASNTGAVTIDDPPTQIAAACKSLGLPLYQMEFVTKSHFGALGDDEWRAFKDPGAYDALAVSNPGAYEDLKRLYFVVQRAPLEFAADRAATGLTAFIDEIRPVIEANHGALPLAERMQVCTRRDALPLLEEAIPPALRAARESL